MLFNDVRWLRWSVPLFVALALVAAAPRAAGAQVNMNLLQSRVVRVVVGEGPAAQAASGFLWVNLRQVVTSLHTFSYRATDPPRIVVTCRGAGGPQLSNARVTKGPADADLVLLTTDQELVGCGAFNSTQVQEAKPADYSQLYTYGFHAGAQGGTSRKMEKGNANPEVLNSLLHEPVRGAIGLGRVPALDLPIYYVEGGLLPGYSGAPVVDADNRLVGIVEGGLDNGASAYNWVIPAANLKRLMVSQETLPARGFIKGAAHFSSPFIESGSTLRLAKEGQPDKPLYDFVSTKTRSLGQLASTSASPEDFEDLLAYGVEMGLDKTAAENLQFDLYEDVRKNLVIAIPTGQQPVFEPPKTVGAGTALRAGAADSRDGTLLFQEYPTEIFVPPNVSPIPPIQSDAFLKMVVDGQLRSCVTEFPWQHTCELIDSDTTPFPSGGALLKYAVLVHAERPLQDFLVYKSFAVHGRTTFYASAGIGLLNNGRMNLRQLANLAAVQITTFGGTAAPAGAAAGPASPTSASNGRAGTNPPAFRDSTASGSLEEGEEITLTLPPLPLGQGTRFPASAIPIATTWISK